MAFKDARTHRGLCFAAVATAEAISPHYVRVTLQGDDLRTLPHRGYDHWFRLFLPVGPGELDWSGLPDRFGMSGYLKFKASRLGSAVAVRNYTVRDHRPEAGEVVVDFVIHGTDGVRPGVAAPWALRARPGDRVALIDQGCGFELDPGAGFCLLAGDESAQPAILGILRDLPRDARGLALIEVPEPADAQTHQAPDGVDVRWIHREAATGTPGARALAELRSFRPASPGDVSAYVVGERTLATGGRRHLVAAGVPKAQVQFVGYWRAGG
jgi:NADPH-dependent ferric siderophore reductase